MNRSLTRKKFLINSSIAVAGMLFGRGVLRAQPGTTALVPSPAPSPQSADNVPDFPEHDPQIDRARVKRFVIAGHFNLPAVEKMLAEDPTLINGAIDWGNGDFETALGGASHMAGATSPNSCSRTTRGWTFSPRRCWARSTSSKRQ